MIPEELLAKQNALRIKILNLAAYWKEDASQLMFRQYFCGIQVQAHRKQIPLLWNLQQELGGKWWRKGKSFELREIERLLGVPPEEDKNVYLNIAIPKW